MLQASMFLREAILDQKANSRIISLHLAIESDAGYSLEFCRHLAKMCGLVSAEEIKNPPRPNHTRFLKMALTSIALLVDNGFIDDLESSELIVFSFLLEAIPGLSTLFESEEAKQNFIRKSKEKLLERLQKELEDAQQKIKTISRDDPHFNLMNALLEGSQKMLNAIKNGSSEKMSAVLQKERQLLTEAQAIYEEMVQAADKRKEETAQRPDAVPINVPSAASANPTVNPAPVPTSILRSSDSKETIRPTEQMYKTQLADITKKLLMAQESFDQFKNMIPVILEIEGYSEKAFVNFYSGVGVSKENFLKDSSTKFMSTGLLALLQQHKMKSIREDVKVEEHYGNNEEELNYIRTRLGNKEIAGRDTVEQVEESLRKVDASGLVEAEALSRGSRPAAAP
jgi:hypothetical protein